MQPGTRKPKNEDGGAEKGGKVANGCRQKRGMGLAWCPLDGASVDGEKGKREGQGMGETSSGGIMHS